MERGITDVHEANEKQKNKVQNLKDDIVDTTAHTKRNNERMRYKRP